MRRTVWAVTHGEYSDYGVTAIYENKADAVAVAGQYDDVEEMTFYTTGDRSRRQVSSWGAYIKVTEDGRILGEPTTHYDKYDVMDDDGLLDEGSAERPYGHRTHWNVSASALTKDKAIKGCKDRAAELAAQIVEGMDPRDIVHGEATETDIQVAWIDALIENERHEEAAKRKHAADEKMAAYRAKCKLEEETLVAIFDGDTQLSVWRNLSTGYAPLPAAFDHARGIDGLSICKKDGTLARESMALSMVAGSDNWAVIWPTVKYPWNKT